MERPLEIGFHNLEPSAALEAEIRENVDKLAARYGHMIGCRVSIEALHRQHQTGNIYEAHVVVSVPGRDLAVSREPHHAKDRFANPDVRVSLRQAFAAAERQLKDFASKRRAEHRVPKNP